MHLACQSPSSETFSTWKQAKSYYNICFNDGSVIIRAPLQNQTPTQSPVWKKSKVNLKLLEHEPLAQWPFSSAFSTPKAKGSASQPINVSSTESTPASHLKLLEHEPLAQPPFSSAFSTPKAKGSASQLINVSSTKSTPASHSTCAYTLLYFPESPRILSKPANSRKHPHAGFQDILHQTHNSSSHPGGYPESAGILANPRNTPNVTSPSRQYPELWIPGEKSLTFSPPYPTHSLGHIDPHYVYVDSSSDEGAVTDSNDNSATAARPGPSSSLIVEVHSDAPTHHTGSPVIIISDSEEEEEEAEHKLLWPHPMDHDSIDKLNALFGAPGLSPWNAEPFTSVVRNLVCH